MTDLEIRIFEPQRDALPALKCRVEARLNDAASFTGEATFDVKKLVEATNDPIAYGRRLRDALLASPALQRAYLKASALSPVRLRLVADAPEIAALRWERLMLDTDEEDRPAAASPYTPFSRYVELEKLPDHNDRRADHPARHREPDRAQEPRADRRRGRGGQPPRRLEGLAR